jgi:hypothetical protein
MSTEFFDGSPPAPDHWGAIKNRDMDKNFADFESSNDDLLVDIINEAYEFGVGTDFDYSTEARNEQAAENGWRLSRLSLNICLVC